MATDAAPAITTPVAVRWSAVMPVRRMLSPTGFRPASKLCRQRPSNIRQRVSAGLVQIPASRRRARRIPRQRGNSRWWPPSGVRSSTAFGSRTDEPGPDLRRRDRRPSPPWKLRTGARDAGEVEPGLELVGDVLAQAVRGPAARWRTAPRPAPRPRRAPGASSRPPTSPASSSTWSSATSGVRGSGTRNGTTSAASSLAGTSPANSSAKARRPGAERAPPAPASA